jgi:ABC-type bacteriocin/lantibiotic exporter with double-glycine peptidase domain
LNLEKFLESGDGKSREIRSDSTNISGGERQRIAIARAKFFDTSIVVLDEPTSALDVENERRVIEYLEEIFHKKTVIFITHSESLLNVADLVLYLEEGKVMFFGGVSNFREWKSRL